LPSPAPGQAGNDIRSLASLAMYSEQTDAAVQRKIKVVSSNRNFAKCT